MLCVAECLDEVCTDVFFEVATADREDEDGVALAKTAAGEPARVASVPAIVVDARGQLANVVGGRVALDAGYFAEVVDGMAGVACAAAYSEEEDAAVVLARLAKDADHFVDLFLVESRGDVRDFYEVFGRVLAQVCSKALNEIWNTSSLTEQPIYWRVPNADMTIELPPLALLAGGLATRMRPITQTIPKSMIEVAGEPFITHQLRLLVGEGVREVVVCAGYRGEQIEEFVGDGARFGCRVRYSYDGETLLGTGGAVVRALPMLGERFFVMYGDSYLRLDMRAMFAAFCGSRLPAMMAVFRNEGKWDTSNVEFADGVVRVYDKHARAAAMRYIDYGVGVLTAGLFAGRAAEFDLSEIYRDAARRGELAGWEADERFYEIGSPSGLAELSELLEKGRTV